MLNYLAGLGRNVRAYSAGARVYSALPVLRSEYLRLAFSDIYMNAVQLPLGKSSRDFFDGSKLK